MKKALHILLIIMSGAFYVKAQSLNDTILIKEVDIVDYKKQKEFYNYCVAG